MEREIAINKVLAIDIGGGTQDLLLFDKNTNLENCIQLVLPSPTRLVAAKIARATEENKTLFLYGKVMGGGPSVRAIKRHLAKSLPVVATGQAALTIHDNVSRVRELGVIIDEEMPAGAAAVRLGDINTEMLQRILAEVGEDLPEQFAVAVQDHGYSPDESNRIFRFRIWEQFMNSGGLLRTLAYRMVPPFLTRMRAAADSLPGSLFMDTCSAALLGALTDVQVREAADTGAVAILNLGNQHTFAAIVQGDRVLGLLEHHTARMTPETILYFLDKMIKGVLTNQEVLTDGGHGCVSPQRATEPGLTVVTGPRRELLGGEDFYFAAPQGNMMLMGCYGLLKAALEY